MSTDGLRNAQLAKKDEFYTQLSDIEKEMRYYRASFENKTVFCNCDDPFESNFFKYFAMNFNFLKLKKLICTCYAGSPISHTELDDLPLFSQNKNDTEKVPYMIQINEVSDQNGDGAVDMSDIEILLRNDKNLLTILDGDGDFRSEESIEWLKESDIIVTNPPFSLFREFVAQLIEYDKKFLIIGNVNAITYKEFFPLIQENKVWMGASIHSGDREFRVPDSYPLKASGYRISEDGKKYIRVKGVRWWTNLDYQERHEDLILYSKYSADKYPKYDNYDAINVNTTKDIPCDYGGVMGVPITFLDKYNPDQFEIIGIAKRGAGDPSLKTKVYTKNDFSNYSDLNAGPVLMDENGKLFNTYPRILIRRKQ